MLLTQLPERCIVHADRAYNTNRVRDLIQGNGAVSNIQPKRTGICKSCFSNVRYKGCTVIERMRCRLKDCRRIATRYDRLATSFLRSVHLAAAIMWRSTFIVGQCQCSTWVPGIDRSPDTDVVPALPETPMTDLVPTR